MDETRAYITQILDDRAELTVREGCSLYGNGTGTVLTEQYALEDDGVDYVMGAQPEQPFREADRILAAHGWKREGRWLIGDVVTGTYARVARA